MQGVEKQAQHLVGGVADLHAKEASVQAWDSFMAISADYHTDCHVLSALANGCSVRASL